MSKELLLPFATHPPGDLGRPGRPREIPTVYVEYMHPLCILQVIGSSSYTCLRDIAKCCMPQVPYVDPDNEIGCEQIQLVSR
jgi:hypothetical protein